MRATGRSNSYVDRILDSLRSALSRAYKMGEITACPSIATIEREPHERRIVGREEIAAMWAAAEEPHLRMFLAVLMNTGARPNAILALTRFQINFERRLVNLHPPGRARTKKRNPVLPITDHLLPWLQAATGDYVVAWRGKALDSIKSAWRRARARAGLPADFTPYSIRHALATELRARGVPEWECAGWLGHVGSFGTTRWNLCKILHKLIGHVGSFGTTEIYARFRPDYLSQARVAIDAWVKEIGPLFEQRPGHVETPVRVSYVSGPKAEVLQPLETAKGS